MTNNKTIILKMLKALAWKFFYDNNDGEKKMNILADIFSFKSH